MIEPESALPRDLHDKAVRTGRELAWRLDDVFSVIDAAGQVGLACLGGQPQFVFPDGTCELFSGDFGPTERTAIETSEALIVCRIDCVPQRPPQENGPCGRGA